MNVESEERQQNWIWRMIEILNWLFRLDHVRKTLCIKQKCYMNVTYISYNFIRWTTVKKRQISFISYVSLFLTYDFVILLS